MYMKEQIREAAYSLGIEIIGFTDVLDYSYLWEFMYNRVKSGYNSEFEETDINKRLDVRSVFQNCRSIIAVGLPYGEGYRKLVTRTKGLLSVSSYGEDYHKKLGILLSNIAEEIKKEIYFEYKICVDTSPLLDREICKNAGLGSYGKNSLLINEKFGSFINLGYLLTDLDIDCDNKINNIDICGECNLCIKNCPNSAILKEGGINSKKCISYLTQTKNYIPFEYRKNMRNQIYGCDVCQLVCPKNIINSQKEPSHDYGSLLIDVEELMLMNNKEFTSKYGYLAGSWRGKNIWKRNALITIGNLKLDNMYDLVENELKNPSDMIKMYAAWCLLRLNKIDSKKTLLNRMKFENNEVKEEYIKLMEAEL